MALYESPELENMGGGSGIKHMQHETQIGRISVTHWKLHLGHRTEMEVIPTVFGYGEIWPTICLAGHVEVTDALKLYMHSLATIGGETALVHAILRATHVAHEDGKNAARAEIRAALGLP